MLGNFASYNLEGVQMTYTETLFVVVLAFMATIALILAFRLPPRKGRHRRHSHNHC